MGERGVRRRARRRAKLAGPRPARAARARGRAAGGRGGDRRADGAAAQSARTSVRREGALRRGRAAEAPGAGDRRGDAAAGRSGCWRRTSTISRSCCKTRTASPRPSRSIAARWRSTRRAFGPDHPEVAIDLNNLAILLKHTNRLAEAEPLYRRALAIDEASYGPDHPEVAIDLNNLARIAASDEPPRRGRAALSPRAGDSTRRASGRTIPMWRLRLNNLAGLLQATNRLGEAEPLYRRALAIDEASLRAGPSGCRDATSTISRACSKPRTASPRPSRSIAARSRSTRRASGRDHPDVADPPQQSRGPAPSHEPPRRGRAALPPRARDLREKPRSGSPEHSDRARKPRRDRDGARQRCVSATAGSRPSTGRSSASSCRPLTQGRQPDVHCGSSGGVAAGGLPSADDPAKAETMLVEWGM